GATLASGDKRVYFVYRGDGQRAQMSTSTWNGSIWTSTINEYFLWADGKIIHKRVGSTSATTRTHYYDQGETRHTGTGAPTKHYYTKDHLGTIHGITSGTGTVEASFRYDPYGL